MHWTCMVIGNDPEFLLEPFNNQDNKFYSWENVTSTGEASWSDYGPKEVFLITPDLKDPRFEITVVDVKYGTGKDNVLKCNEPWSGYIHTEYKGLDNKGIPYVNLFKRYRFKVGDKLPSELIDLMIKDKCEDYLITTIPEGNFEGGCFIYDDVFEKLKESGIQIYDTLYVINYDFVFLSEWSFYNHKAFYDWYAVGGRWSKMLLIKDNYIKRNFRGEPIGTKDLPDDVGSPYIYPDMSADSLPIKAIDFKRMRYKAYCEAVAKWDLWENILVFAGFNVNSPPTWKPYAEVIENKHAQGVLNRLNIELDYNEQGEIKVIKKAIASLINKSKSRLYIKRKDIEYKGTGGKIVTYFDDVTLLSYFNGIDYFALGKEHFINCWVLNYLCAHSYLYKGQYVESKATWGIKTKKDYEETIKFIDKLEHILCSEEEAGRLTVVDLHN
jgi:hypothetical protein